MEEITRGPMPAHPTTTAASTATSPPATASTSTDTAVNSPAAANSMMTAAPDVRGAPAKVCPTDQESIEPQPRTRTGRREMDKRSLDYLSRSGLAGGLAGCAAKTIVGPLDRVKILFQTSNPQFAKYSGSWFGLAKAMQIINKDEGVRGLFKGHSATLLRIFPYAAIKFLAYEQVRAVLIPNRQKETPFRRLISGSLAGVTSVFCTYPLELIRVRLAFETKHQARSSLRKICRQIYHEGGQPSSQSASSSSSSASALSPARSGLVNFYRGFSPTMAGMLPYAGMSFLTHDTVGDWLRHPSVSHYTTIPASTATQTDPSSTSTRQHSRRAQLTASAELFSGAVAGLISQTSSYPLEVIRRRMQVAGAVSEAGRRTLPSIAQTARTIWLERGFRGFWVGLTVGYMKIIPMTATGFYVYERAKWFLGI